MGTVDQTGYRTWFERLQLLYLSRPAWRKPMQLPHGSRTWHIHSPPSIFIGPRYNVAPNVTDVSVGDQAGSDAE